MCGAEVNHPKKHSTRRLLGARHGNKTGTEQGQNMVPQTPKFALETVKTPVRRVFPAGRPSYFEHCWNKGLNAQEVSFARVPDPDKEHGPPDL